MSELRKDPIVDRWVVIAEERAARPGAYRQDAPSKRNRSEAYLVDCPFCVGNEASTPPVVYEQRNGQGRWNVRIVPNRYPAVSRTGDIASHEPNRRTATGAHEVVIEAPQHAIELMELPPEQVCNVLKAWRDRIAEHRRAGKWEFVFLFKNSGREAGATMDHVHSQLIALPRVMQAVAKELDAADSWRRRQGGCAFCALLDRERQAAVRMVIDGGHFVAVVAFAGRQPYETWILPVEHDAAFDRQRDDQLESLAAVLAQLLQALRRTLPICAYNVILHSAPFDTHWDDRYHWHIEILPRISGLAGFELGGGEFINPVSPERAAAELNGNLPGTGKL